MSALASRRTGRAPALPAWDGGLRPTDVVGSFFLAGCAMILAGALIAVGDSFGLWTTGRWLPLHLVLLGGISQLVLGASLFFAGAFLATDPPSRTLIRALLLIWNAGTLMLAVVVQARIDSLSTVVATVLMAGLAVYALGLLEMKRRSLGTVPWASRWYLAATAFLVPGIVAGAALARGTYAIGGEGDLLAAHIALNVGGWFGTAIVGTLHTFFPSLTHSRLRHPRLQGPTFAAWVAGIASLALGYGLAFEPLATAGWAALLGAAALLAVNLVGSLRGAERGISLPALIIAAGQVYLVVGLGIATIEALASGPEAAFAGSTRAAVGTTLLAGWVGMTVFGSLLHLLSLLLRARDLRRPMPQPQPLRDGLLVGCVALAVGALTAVQLLDTGASHDWARYLLIAAYAVLGTKVALLGAKVAIDARPQI